MKNYITQGKVRSINVNIWFITVMGGHGHGPPYTIPKYTEFQIKGIPQLEELEKALAQKGLKDPWIRLARVAS